MATNRSRHQVQFRGQKVLAAPILQDPAGSDHCMELVDKERTHSLALEIEGFEDCVRFLRPARLRQEVDQLVGTRDWVLVRLTLMRFRVFLWLSGQEMQLRQNVWI